MKGQFNNWNYEVVNIELRKCESYGDPFTGFIQLKVIDGKMHATSLICPDFDKSDIEDLKVIVRRFGYKEVYAVKYSNGKPRVKIIDCTIK